MDKVVLLPDRSEEREPLISCLKLLFPECDIQIQPKQVAKFERTSRTLKPSTAFRMDRDFARRLRKIIAENSC
ncbi:MAG: hypothetical protein WBB70_02275 [Desulfobacterales bacterium]